jgi:sodium/bile acid cotransporter 7
VLGALPTTITMCIILTTAAGGDEPAALYNATSLNLIGIFITPAWLYILMNAVSTIPFGDVILKLFIKIIIPLMIGQAIQYFPYYDFKPHIQVTLNSYTV